MTWRAARWAALASLGLALFASTASAHAVGVSKGEYRASGAVVHVVYAFSATELAATIPSLDVDHDGRLSAQEVHEGAAGIDAAIVQATQIGAAGGSCAPHLESTRLTDTDAVEIGATFACDGDVRSVAIDCDFLESFAADHRHLAVVAVDGQETSALATLAKRRIEVDARRPAARGASFLAMIGTGVEHILTGYDHLAFLVGLLLLGGSVRGLVATVTAFTVAHSITLGLAATGLVSVSPSIVEPAIALSIGYVGVENLFAPDASRRWRITFPFGLLHGFGFAGALTDLHLSRTELPAALLAFNLGVELGQMAVLAAVLPLIAFARKGAWFRERGVKALSAALALAGVLWFVQRVSWSPPRVSHALARRCFAVST